MSVDPHSCRDDQLEYDPQLQLTPNTGMGIYIHVPFCATRCGYCDFNTYTTTEIGNSSPQSWLEALRIELSMAARQLGSVSVDTVFVGGGTPSLLGASGLADVINAVHEHFLVATDAEITTEANPESTSAQFFEQIRAAGYTRVSLGMQSVIPSVLAVLERAHCPERALQAAVEAHAAGFEHVNLDLIYGTAGESDDDLVRSVHAALSTGVDHISAYALVVEEGTALARRVRRGDIVPPDDDVLAHRYVLVDQLLSAAGLQWYEISNWSRPGGQCRHNLGYWNGGQWWGAGPGAHGFIGAIRWWNVKHPSTYADRLSRGMAPIADFERLDAMSRHREKVLLGIRLRQGLPVTTLTVTERQRAQRAVADGLLVDDGDWIRLTDRGRLLADGIVRDLLDD